MAGNNARGAKHNPVTCGPRCARRALHDSENAKNGAVSGPGRDEGRISFPALVHAFSALSFVSLPREKQMTLQYSDIFLAYLSSAYIAGVP